MKSPRFFWVIATLVLVAATQGAVVAVRAKYEPRSIRAPRAPLTDLPATMGEWQADAQSPGDSGVSKTLFEAIGAQDVVTRNYNHPDGWSCSVHMATWHETDEWMPHPPDLCYKGAGFAMRGKTNVPLPGHDKARVCETKFTNSSSGTSVTTVYWYQMGDQTYFNRDGSRPVRRSFWGSPERPPLVKVLMQCGNPDSDERDRQLEALANSVYEFAASL